MTGPVPRLVRCLVICLLGAAVGAVAASCGSDTVEPQGNALEGELIVEDLEPNCGACHRLGAAEFEGTSAPSLDLIQPGYERVFRAIERGPGAMPSYSDRLDSDELHHVAAYIAEAVSGDGAGEPGPEQEAEEATTEREDEG